MWRKEKECVCSCGSSESGGDANSGGGNLTAAKSNPYQLMKFAHQLNVLLAGIIKLSQAAGLFWPVRGRFSSLQVRDQRERDGQRIEE